MLHLWSQLTSGPYGATIFLRFAPMEPLTSCAHGATNAFHLWNHLRISPMEPHGATNAFAIAFCGSSLCNLLSRRVAGSEIL